ncbi:unnamed protein product [Nippostrongylus brasiliensis]|uniref:CPSF_A domain-containing protein n=1 Tax=Nippostrongylus brasiliensis TaxID=27835 RepID=A0A0N4XVD0_NIPBR|nr:unnamed protein product [Nippostrongylus brasiliensis]
MEVEVQLKELEQCSGTIFAHQCSIDKRLVIFSTDDRTDHLPAAAAVCVAVAAPTCDGLVLAFGDLACMTDVHHKARLPKLSA